MSLNIKNERTHELVRELASLTGQSQSSAVEDAVRRRLNELQQHAGDKHEFAKFAAPELERRRASIDRILSELHAETTSEQWAALDGAEESLYDDAGLPA